MPRPKKGDPELLLVSFCDIVTIVTAALFMAMIVVIDESTRIPAIRPMPLVRETTNSPVYFECRQDQVFPINLPELNAKFHEMGQQLRAKARAEGLRGVEAFENVMTIDTGNEYYKFDDAFILIGTMALRAQTNSPKGTTVHEILESPQNNFRLAIDKLDPESQYIVFLVRDDSFNVFRRARELVTSKKFYSGWDFLERDEPITAFGSLGGRVKIQ